MSDPVFKWSREPLRLTISGLTGGWRLGDLGRLNLAEQAQLEFPTAWNQYKSKASLDIIQFQWNLHHRLVLENTLTAGVEYTSKDGVGQSLSVDSSLLLHLLERPTTKIDMKLNVELEGTANRGGYEGSATAGLKLQFWF